MRIIRRIALLLATIVAALALPAPTAAQAAPEGWPGYVRGTRDAQVTVIEFSDFGCPYCGSFALRTYPSLHREYVATGKVRWIYVPFVMGMFPNGDRAALAAECAADAGGVAAFWPMHDRLFETQRTWKQARDPEAHFRSLAAEAQIDVASFGACYHAERPQARITRNNELSADAGVRATPTFFVQGRRVEGALPLEAFRALLDDAVRNAER